jgi:hypothetical protein
MTEATALHTQETSDDLLATRLGHAGLAPFILLALMLWLLDGEERAFVSIALAGYGALIVSFLGGVHWAMAWALPHSKRAHAPNLRRQLMLWGITTPLLAWPGVLMPPFAGLAWLGFLLVICYLADRTLYPRAGLQAWLTLRFRLSAVAALCCFIGAGAV